jgi:hypothetical protein
VGLAFAAEFILNSQQYCRRYLLTDSVRFATPIERELHSIDQGYAANDCLVAECAQDEGSPVTRLRDLPSMLEKLGYAALAFIIVLLFVFGTRKLSKSRSFQFLGDCSMSCIIREKTQGSLCPSSSTSFKRRDLDW